MSQEERRRTSGGQREILLAFMQEHEKFAKSQYMGPDAAQIKRVLLKRLTHQLNSVRFGVKKTPEKWLKSWQDWKSDVRAKQLRIKKINRLKLEDRDEDQIPCPLNKLEEKLLLLINGNVEHLNDDITSSREPIVSLAQRQQMFAFMDTHEELAFNIISGPDQEQIKKGFLNQLAQQLNLIGPAIKTGEKWFKYWLEWKSKVIAKVKKNKAYTNSKEIANMDDDPPCTLTTLEKKLYQFIDVDVVSEDEEIDERLVPRDKRVAVAQREMMFAFMQANPDFAKRQITGPFSSTVKRVMLNKLANKLNSMGPVTKTPEKWLKSWLHWKSDIKAKWYKLNHFKLTETIMHDYARCPAPLTPLEEKLVKFLGFDQHKNTDEQTNTWQDKKSTLKRQAMNNSKRTELPTLQPKNIDVSETAVPGPSNSQECGLVTEDVFETEFQIKEESPDSPDPLNVEEQYLEEEYVEEEYLKSDPPTPEPEPEPEPEIEQPTHKSSTPPRKRRLRKVLRRPVTQARLDTINNITVNEVKNALIEKNAIKKQFYADYMVEIRKQTQALITIANKLSNR